MARKKELAPNDLPYRVSASSASIGARYRAYRKMYDDERNIAKSMVMFDIASAHFFACLHWAGLSVDEYNLFVGKEISDSTLWNPTTRQILIDFQE